MVVQPGDDLFGEFFPAGFADEGVMAPVFKVDVVSVVSAGRLGADAGEY
jgi:hypothetical protein